VVEGIPLLIGRDPRTIPIEQLKALGHEKHPLLRVIRTNCVACVGGSEAEVRRCRLLHCPFWPYRMGRNPFHRQELTGAERRERSARARANRTAQLRQPRQGRGTGDNSLLDAAKALARGGGADAPTAADWPGNYPSAPMPVGEC